MVLWFVSLSPASGSVLTAQSLEPWVLCLPLSLPLPAHAHALSQKEVKTLQKKLNKSLQIIVCKQLLCKQLTIDQMH